MKQIDNLKKLLMQNGIENVPNAEFISDALEKLEEIEQENRDLRRVAFNAGSDFSEDELISKGINFPDWEKGFNDAIKAVEKNISSV